MKELNFDGPLNSLSFGNVSLNILRELYKQGVKVNLFPTGNSIELSAFNNVDDDFVEWLKNSQRNALRNHLFRWFYLRIFWSHQTNIHKNDQF